jgi:UDP-N-acetylmuramoyl-L-alanyl-D-glutamate--2,6-diaminopimelate ligase
MLKDLKSYGTEYLAIEATSHALFEDRLAGIAPKIAAFTSFSRDHLDFHQTMEHYFNTKMKLFNELLLTSGSAVINADMSEFELIKKQCLARGIQVIGYGYNINAELRLIKIKGDLEQQQLLFRFAEKDYKVTIPFPGEYQVKNLLCAVGILMASGFNLEQIMPHVPKLKLIPGRMQKVADYRGGRIFIDYAHTDDGLSMLLKNIKEMTSGKILLVFGAGGNRDQGKRSLLGEVAETYADFIVITDDNPRTENPQQIRAAIAATCPRAHVIGDRREAIRFAMDSIQKNDVLVVAGKGTDNGQIVGYECLPFSDYDTIIEMVQAQS